MPPLVSLSDEERSSSSDVEQTPPTQKGKAAKEVVHEEIAEGGDGEEDEDEGDEEEDEFVVEKIVGHRINKGNVQYDVQWQGYDEPQDRTWEDETNLEDGARDTLLEYWAEIGGKPEGRGKKKGPQGTKRKGRQSIAASESATPASSTKRVKKEPEWSPPAGSWEADVDYVDTVEEGIDPKTGAPARYGYLVWRNQKKTQHPLPHIYQKCPQKMLIYYESHLVFKDHTGDDPLNGNNVSMDDDV